MSDIQTELTTMEQVVALAGNLETPNMAKAMSQHLTSVLDGTAARMEDAARILLDQAAELRKESYAVSDALVAVIARGRQLDDLTASTLTSFRGVPRPIAA